MSRDELIASYIVGTSLDFASVKLFVQTPPHYYQWGVNRRLDQASLRQLNATDLFEFYLRLYLTGRHKTLYAVLRQVRSFVEEDAAAAPCFITYSLDLTRSTLLDLEWYELLPRLEAARTIILRAAPENHSLRPLVIRFLKES